ncbi:MAG: hypothetical protein JWP12_317 [Bacteroidetes bacterium]|nr:hypothetical protein [Bacteroidota bacterium]
MYGDNFFQSKETIRWALGIVFGFILGVITGWFKFKC